MISILDHDIPTLSGEIYMRPIWEHPEIHYRTNWIIGYLIHDVILNQSYYFNIFHPDVFYTEFSISELIDSCKVIYCIGRKELIAHLGQRNFLDIRYSNETIDIEFLQRPTWTKTVMECPNAGRIIPLTSYLGHFLDEIDRLRPYFHTNYLPHTAFYNKLVTEVFRKLDLNHWKTTIPKRQWPDYPLYNDYQIDSDASRPTNHSYGVNFMSLSKKDATRSHFLPRYDEFVQFDFVTNQFSLICQLIDYYPDWVDAYEELGKIYFKTEIIDREAAKIETLRLLYSDVLESDYQHEFFDRFFQFKSKFINDLHLNGYIESPISRKRLHKTAEKTPNLAILLQMMELEASVILMDKIFRLLETKKSELRLYLYDAFLVDFKFEDGETVLEQIEGILLESGCGVKRKRGNTLKDV